MGRSHRSFLNLYGEADGMSHEPILASQPSSRGELLRPRLGLRGSLARALQAYHPESPFEIPVQDDPPGRQFVAGTSALVEDGFHRPALVLDLDGHIEEVHPHRSSSTRDRNREVMRD